MKIALVVDHPNRDLPGLVLVARALAQRGADVFLVPYNLFGMELMALAPHFAVLPHLRRTDEDLAKRLLDANIGLFVLDTEGGVVQSLDTYGRQFSNDDSILKKILMYFSWGPEIGQFLVRAGRLEPEQVTITGSPRFDFYRQPWVRVAGTSSIGPGGSPRPMVLIAGTFSLANPRFRSPEDEAKFLIERAAWDADLVARRQKTEKRCFAGIVKLCNELASWRSDVDWVLRPHPFEDPEAYRAQVADSVQVRTEGTVDGWILRSSALVHRGSTTAVEGALAGVPVLTPSWLPEWFRMDSLSSVSVECDDLRELKERLTTVLEGGAPAPGLPSDVQAELGRWFGSVDGRAHERIANVILDGGTHLQGQPSLRRCRQYVYGVGPRGRSLSHQLLRRFRMWLRITPGFSLRQLRFVDKFEWWDASVKCFHPASVGELLRSLDSVSEQAESLTSLQIHANFAKDEGEYRVPYPHGRSVFLQRSPVS